MGCGALLVGVYSAVQLCVALPALVTTAPPTSPTTQPTRKAFSDPTTTPVCYFSCGSACLQQQLVCDFHPDCEEGEDEEHCGQCDFESGLCGWEDTTEGADTE